MPLTKDKEFDCCIIVLGIRGVGKSTYALGRAVELGRKPAYVLAHDPGHRLPAGVIGSNGKSTPVSIQYHDTIQSGAQSIGRTPSGVHAFAVPDGYQVLALGKEVSAASLRAHQGKGLVPSVVLLDEGVSIGGSSTPYRQSDELRQDLALLRHHNVGLIITCQDPGFLHYSSMTLSTEIVLFRMNDMNAIAKTIRMGVPEEIAMNARSLAKYQHIVHKQM